MYIILTLLIAIIYIFLNLSHGINIYKLFHIYILYYDVPSQNYDPASIHLQSPSLSKLFYNKI